MMLKYSIHLVAWRSLLRAVANCIVLLSLTHPHLFANEINILRPRPREVIQRVGFVASKSHVNNQGGPQYGVGEVEIVFESNFTSPDVTWEYRVEVLDNGWGESKDWQRFSANQLNGVSCGFATVQAGGWYRLDLRGRVDESTVAKGSIGPFGVGEVFLIAGQSYAAGENDAHLKVADPQGRIVAFNMSDQSWQVANDPFPDVGDGGTIWPPMGNNLLPIIRVPIGFVNVAASGTSSQQWLPGTLLFEKLRTAGEEVGDFRMVLWQQGESDVLESTTIDQYVANVKQIRDQLNHHWNKESIWLLAKSTHHPTVYDEPEREHRIRTAIDILCGLPGFRLGPDTDILGDENRGGPESRRHFSEIGQHRAGLMWFASIWNELKSIEAE